MGTLDKCGNLAPQYFMCHLPVRKSQTWKISPRNEVLLKHPKIFYSLSSHRSMVSWRFAWSEFSSSKAAALSLVRQRELLGSLEMHFVVLHWRKKRKNKICCVLSRVEALHFKGLYSHVVDFKSTGKILPIPFETSSHIACGLCSKQLITSTKLILKKTKKMLASR